MPGSSSVKAEQDLDDNGIGEWRDARSFTQCQQPSAVDCQQQQQPPPPPPPPPSAQALGVTTRSGGLPPDQRWNSGASQSQSSSGGNSGGGADDQQINSSGTRGGGGKKGAKKPHLQGRFSGRLATKEDERRLTDECRLLGPLLGGVGKRGDGSRQTLAKIVRGIASGHVRAHCEGRERKVESLKQRAHLAEEASRQLEALRKENAELRAQLQLKSRQLVGLDDVQVGMELDTVEAALDRGLAAGALGLLADTPQPGADTEMQQAVDIMQASEAEQQAAARQAPPPLPGLPALHGTSPALVAGGTPSENLVHQSPATLPGELSLPTAAAPHLEPLANGPLAAGPPAVPALLQQAAPQPQHQQALNLALGGNSAQSLPFGGADLPLLGRPVAALHPMGSISEPALMAPTLQEVPLAAGASGAALPPLPGASLPMVNSAASQSVSSLSAATQVVAQAAQVAQQAQQAQVQAQSMAVAAHVHAQKAQEASSSAHHLQATVQAIAHTHTQLVKKIEDVRTTAAAHVNHPAPIMPPEQVIAQAEAEVQNLQAQAQAQAVAAMEVSAAAQRAEAEAQQHAHAHAQAQAQASHLQAKAHSLQAQAEVLNSTVAEVVESLPVPRVLSSANLSAMAAAAAAPAAPALMPTQMVAAATLPINMQMPGALPIAAGMTAPAVSLAVHAPVQLPGAALPHMPAAGLPPRAEAMAQVQQEGVHPSPEVGRQAAPAHMPPAPLPQPVVTTQLPMANTALQPGAMQPAMQPSPPMQQLVQPSPPMQQLVQPSPPQPQQQQAAMAAAQQQQQQQQSLPQQMPAGSVATAMALDALQDPLLQPSMTSAGSSACLQQVAAAAAAQQQAQQQAAAAQQAQQQAVAAAAQQQAQQHAVAAAAVQQAQQQAVAQHLDMAHAASMQAQVNSIHAHQQAQMDAAAAAAAVAQAANLQQQAEMSAAIAAQAQAISVQQQQHMVVAAAAASLPPLAPTQREAPPPALMPGEGGSTLGLPATSSGMLHLPRDNSVSSLASGAASLMHRNDSAGAVQSLLAAASQQAGAANLAAQGGMGVAGAGAASVPMPLQAAPVAAPIAVPGAVSGLSPSAFALASTHASPSFGMSPMESASAAVAAAQQAVQAAAAAMPVHQPSPTLQPQAVAAVAAAAQQQQQPMFADAPLAPPAAAAAVAMQAAAAAAMAVPAGLMQAPPPVAMPAAPPSSVMEAAVDALARDAGLHDPIEAQLHHSGGVNANPLDLDTLPLVFDPLSVDSMMAPTPTPGPPQPAPDAALGL